MSLLEASVWDGATPTTMLAILEGAALITWTDLLADVGSGSCELSAYDPKAQYCTEGNLIKFSLGGIPVFGYFIEAPVLLSGEAADNKWTLAGQSVLAYTRYGEVYPAGWSGNGTYSVTRSWTSATYGTILKTLIDEAQARGSIPAMTYDFTTTLDSAGASWTADRTLTIDVGSSLLDVIKKFVALGMGVSMDPQLVLHAYVPGTQGTNLSSTVIWRQGYHFRAPVSNTGNRANMSSVALVRGTVTAGSALFIECTDSAATGDPYIGRRESPLDYSTVSGDSTLMTSAGNQQIALSETASQAVQVQLTHGLSSFGLFEPYADYHLGDTVAIDLPAPPVPTPIVGNVPPADLQAAINAASPGDTIDATGGIYSGAFTINKALTIKGGTITVAASTTGITIAAGTDSLTLNGVSITGNQSHNYVAAEQGILVNGTAGSPVTHLTIKNCSINNFGGAGIWANFCSNLLFTGNTISDIFYAGIMVISGATGTVSNNSVARIGVGWTTGGSGGGLDANNCYGIALSDSGGAASSYITVSGNSVVDVPTWHAYDTHSGSHCDFTSNTLYRCSAGIWIASVTHTAQYVTATYNTVGSPSPVNFNLQAVLTYNTDHVTIQYNTINGWGGNNITDYGGGSTNLVTTPNTIT